MGNELEFTVDSDGRIQITRFASWESRGRCAVEILSDLVENAPEHFRGQSGIIRYGDTPPPDGWGQGHELAFCSIKSLGTSPGWLPFPCPMILRWPEVGVPDAEVLMCDLLVDESLPEDERMFWIGAHTHPTRRALAELSRKHPERLDAELMEWDRRAPGSQRSKTRQVSLPDHRKYKYLIDCPGRGYSARIKWLLAMRRPLFIVDRPVVEHWHEEMEPWVHFVPVKEDLSDLFEHLDRLEADPALAASIAANGRRFAAEHLTVEARLRHTLEAMDRRFPERLQQRTAPGAADDEEEVVHLGQGMGLAELVRLMRAFLASPKKRLWIVDERVHFDFPWDGFQRSFRGSGADLLATEVRSHAEDPEWNWWSSLKAPGELAPTESGVASLLPLIRLSWAAAGAVISGIDAGWNGHAEALVPTLISRAGLTIEDIGGTGSFTPADRLGRWYDKRTWHWNGLVEHVPGKLHFPVPVATMPLAPARLPVASVAKDPLARSEPRVLYVSPVGGAAGSLLPEVLEAFGKAGADRWLLRYDDLELPLPTDARIIADRGYKWQLALRHLHPDAVADYDFIFFWDDDLRVAEFDPRRFVQIMRANRLDMAQPAITSPFGLSHAVTKHRPCPPPLRGPDGASLPIVGRMTNFVEVMAPVFTRDAWREFYAYLDPTNRSGWGYDYIPLPRKGIVDLMPVVHTRPIQSINGASEADLRRFLGNQGLFRYQPMDLGWLLDPAVREMAETTLHSEPDSARNRCAPVNTTHPLPPTSKPRTRIIGNTEKRKIFCIGLHKTGTTSLHAMALSQGLAAIHSTDWAYDREKLRRFDFFADGGSHFCNQNEFDFKLLASLYPDALFLLQTRNPNDWIESKLKHAGWNENTAIQPDREDRVTHSQWRYKSLLTVDRFISHKFIYEEKVKSFFRASAPERLLILDITDRNNHQATLENLRRFLGWRRLHPSPPHKNKSSSNTTLPKKLLDFINVTLDKFPKD